MIPCLISTSLVPMARATSSATILTSRGVKSSFGRLPPPPPTPIAILPSRAYPMAKPCAVVERCGRACSRSPSRQLLESPWLLIPYKRDLAPGTGCLGAESKGAADAGLFVCALRRNTSAPPARQAPTTHGVQLVSPSRCSIWETAGASFGGILADVARRGGGGGGRNDSLATRSCFSRSSCFVFQAAAPARPAITFSVTLSTGGLCAGSSAVS